MSRIGKRFIEVPEKVTIKLDGQKISVDGPKGNLSRILPSLVCCTLDDNKQKIFLEKTKNTKLFFFQITEEDENSYYSIKSYM